MIVDYWKPRYGKINGKKASIYYELIDFKNNPTEKYTDIRVRYTCDNIRCKNPYKIHSTTLGGLYSCKCNTIGSNMCRSCRSILSERSKGVHIPYEVIKEELELEGYTIITKRDEYMYCEYPSQFKISVMCKNGHKHYITRNNWHKGKRCRKCYDVNRLANIKLRKEYKMYKQRVNFYTNKIYSKYKDVINPNDLVRSHKDYHVDHMMSVAYGYSIGILPIIISSHINLRMFHGKDNISKGSDSLLTTKELYEKFDKEVRHLFESDNYI